MHAFSTLTLIALACAALPAQELRRGIADADLVAIGQAEGRKNVATGVVAHRLKIVEGLRGRHSNEATVTILEWTKESHHNRPAPRQQRLYCLSNASRQAERLQLPADSGPYFKLVGWAGSNPVIVGNRATNAIAQFAKILCDAENGTAPVQTAGKIAALALDSDPLLRLEATRLLAERPFWRGRLTGVQWGKLVARTTAETDDMHYKIALAELCAEQRVPGIADALIIGLDTVQTPAYARTVGRLNAHLHGDESVPPLLRRLREHGRDQEHRQALLLAIGATRTGAALDALLELKRLKADDKAVDAALREHKSRKAAEAVMRGKR